MFWSNGNVPEQKNRHKFLSGGGDVQLPHSVTSLEKKNETIYENNNGDNIMEITSWRQLHGDKMENQ